MLAERVIDPSVTVRETMARHPETKEVFARFGVDTCSGSGVPISKRCSMNCAKRPQCPDASGGSGGKGFPYPVSGTCPTPRAGRAEYTVLNEL